MVDFELSERIRELQQRAKAFADEHLRPHAGTWDAERRFPREAVEQAATQGFLGVTVPEEFGGSNRCNVASCVMLEEINRGCASTGVTVSVHNSLFCAPLVKFGTDEQKQRILPKMATGEWLGAYCLSEAGAGSDAAALRCAARRDGDEWVLSGPKLWITTGSEADIFIVFARTDEHRTRGISAFLVEAERDGCEVGKKEVKLGIRASPTTEILLNDCRIPAGNLLGEEGMGFKIALDTLDGGRLGIASQSLGIARASLETCMDYVRDNDIEDQAVHWAIADMATDLEAARLLTWRASALRDRGLPCTGQSAMAKSFASRTCNNTVRRVVSILGTDGLTSNSPAERFLRDARITEIYEGATDIQRLIVSRFVLS